MSHLCVCKADEDLEDEDDLPTYNPKPPEVTIAIDERAALLGVTRCTLRNMLKFKLPILFLAILFYLTQGRECGPEIKGVEYFSGVASIKRAFEDRGSAFETFDKNAGKHENINVDQGFITAVDKGLRTTASDPFAFFAPKCSSWVWVNRGSSKRSPWEPLGDTSKKWVRRANLMVWRTLLLVMFIICKGGRYMLEQPSSSIMDEHPAFDPLIALAVAKKCRLLMVSTWLGLFGAPSPKCIKIYTNTAAAKQVKRTFNRSDSEAFVDGVRANTHKWINDYGEEKHNGNKGALGDSQAYPDEFGRAVAEAVLESENDTGLDDSDSDCDEDLEGKLSEVEWDQCELEDTLFKKHKEKQIQHISNV